MNIPKLSEGALAIIMAGGDTENTILQVLGHKRITGQQEDKERYRLLVSDGRYQISFAMIATQLNDKISSGEITNNAVIKVLKYITSILKTSGQDKRVLVILELEVLVAGDVVGQRIGNPTQLTDSNNPQTHTNGQGPSTSAPAPKPAQSSSSTFQPRVDLNQSTDQIIIHPVSSLSPYQNKWVIKVRVLNKSPIRTWANSRGEGKLFSMDLMDETGEIRATGFRDTVDKFYDMIQVDKVYYISKCIVKAANKQYTNSDYELTLGSETAIVECNDELAVPQVHYKFIPINEISQREVGDILDVLGVCKESSDVVTLVSKTTMRELKKREVTLVDQSNNSISLTLWGNEAENFDSTSNPIIAIRSAKVGEFGGGKNLSVLMSSVMKINPDIPEAHRMRGWYDNVGKDIESTNISARSTTGMPAEWMNFKQVKENKLGSGDKGDYYQVKGTIVLVNSNNCFYQACPTADCNKKVVDLKNGMFRCEKCNREYPEFKYRLIMSMNIADWSDNQWVNTFTGEAEKILGKTSQEVGQAYEENPDNVNAICTEANFSEWIFKCRAKYEMFNDEHRLKTTVIRAEPINYAQYNQHLLDEIKKMIGGK